MKEDPRHTTKKLILAAFGEVFVFFIGAFTPYALFRLFAKVYEFLEWTYFPWNTLYILLLFVIPGLIIGFGLALGFRVAYLRPQVEKAIEQPTRDRIWAELLKRLTRTRVLAVAALTGYAITWAFGTPSVASDIFQNDQAMARNAAEYYDESIQPVSSVVSFAVPILPGVVLAHHHHSGGRLHGWGGWKVYVWYVIGERPLFEVVRWVE